MRDFTQVYLSKKTPDYKMTHQLFTLFWIISNILTFHFYTFSVIYTFYFYIAFEELTFYQKCSIKCVLYSLFYREMEKMDSDATYDWIKCTFLWCESWSLNVTWPLLQVVWYIDPGNLGGPVKWKFVNEHSMNANIELWI